MCMYVTPVLLLHAERISFFTATRVWILGPVYVEISWCCCTRWHLYYTFFDLYYTDGKFQLHPTQSRHFCAGFVTRHVFRGVRRWTKLLPHVRGLGSEGACVGLALAEIQRSPCALLIQEREQHAGESSQVSENSRSEQGGSSRW